MFGISKNSTSTAIGVGASVLVATFAYALVPTGNSPVEAVPNELAMVDREAENETTTTATTQTTTTTTESSSTVEASTTASTQATTVTTAATTQITTTTTTQPATTAAPATTPATTAAPTTTAASGSNGTLNAVEQEIARLINEYRVDPYGQYERSAPPPPDCPNIDGLSPLNIDASVSINLSRDWSGEMADADQMSHRSIDDQRVILTSLGVSFTRWGENVGWQRGFRKGNSTDDAQVALRFFEGWRDSDSHFCNIMNRDYTSMGVGHVLDPDTGKDWATNNFYG